MKYSERLADERDEPCALSGGQTKTRIGALVPLLADSELGTDAAQGLRATCFLFTPLDFGLLGVFRARFPSSGG